MFQRIFVISFIFYLFLFFLGMIHFSKIRFSGSSEAVLNQIITSQVTPEDKNESKKDLNAISEESRSSASDATRAYEDGDFEFYKQNKNTFCVITAVKFNFPSLLASIYTTQGFDACGAKEFKMLAIPSIEAQMQVSAPAFIYLLSPPQLSTMSVNLSKPQEPFLDIGKLRFRKSASAKLPFPALLSNPNNLSDGQLFQPGRLPYVPFNTQEDIYAFWKQGSKIFVLISPKGSYYVMTSFSYYSLKDLQITNLNELSKYLVLKSEWKFVSYTLSKPLIIRHQIASGFSTQRLVDEFGNYYIEINNLND